MSAAAPAAHGQTAGDTDPRVTVSHSSVPVKTVMDNIEKQTGFVFFYNNRLVDVQQRASLKVSNRPLSEALKQLFDATGISFRVMGKQIALFPSNADEKTVSEVVEQAQTAAARQTPATRQQQQRIAAYKVKGVVTDAETGAPLSFATILVKGTNTYAIADVNGRYSLDINTAGAVLSIMSLGYESEEVAVNNRTTLNIALRPRVTAIDEVVVTGFQTISKERATGAYDIMKSDLVERSHSSDLSTALVGASAGLRGTENEDGSFEFIIRGMTTLGTNYAPLVVVDGFPVENGFRDINPNDVESITVLKDAAAASIWGARSANGVIVVVTKKSGRRDKLTIEAGMSFRFGEKLDLSTILTTASSEDQVAYERMAYEKGWIKPVEDNFNTLFSGYSLGKELLYKYDKGLIDKAALDAGLAELSSRNNRRQIKDLMLENPLLQQYNLSISGGNDRTRNYASVMYENAVGNVVRNNTERWRMNFSNTTSIYKWLDFSIGANLHLVKQNTSGPSIGDLRNLMPYEMILNPDGSYAEQVKVNKEQLEKVDLDGLPYSDLSYNLLREVRGREFTEEQFNTRVQAGFLFKIAEGLSFDTKFQYELNKSETDKIYSEDTYYVRQRVNEFVKYDLVNKVVEEQYIPSGGIRQTSNSQGENYSWRNQLNFMRTFGLKHEVNAIAGFEVSQNHRTGKVHPWVYGYNPDRNSSAPILNGGDVTTITGSSRRVDGVAIEKMFVYRKDRFVSVYGNASYTFDGRYSVSGSIRSDASNIISDKASYRWAPLWSVGGLWNVSNEAFMDASTRWLDRLSLRVTYGFNGNVDTSTSHKTLVNMSTVPSSMTGGFTTEISNIGNKFLRWEKTGTANVGVDFSFFSGKLSGSVDVYSKQGRDLIARIGLTGVSGSPGKQQKMNSAKMSNKGIETAIGANFRIAPRVHFTTNVTYAYNKNKITDLKHPIYTANSYFLDGNFIEGYAYGSVWAYEYLGMKDGIAYVKGPGDTEISMDDTSVIFAAEGQEVLKYMGTTIAPHTLGWQGTLNLWGVNVSFLLTGQFGGKFRAPTFGYQISNSGNSPTSYFIREVFEGSDRVPSWPPADRELTSWTWGDYTGKLNTVVESSSYLKLREITVDYRLPQNWIRPLGFESVKVFGQVRNLGTLWVENSYGYDPDWLPGQMKPATTYLLGVTINFK